MARGVEHQLHCLAGLPLRRLAHFAGPMNAILLVKMYLERQVSIEQYENRSGDLAGLVEEWNCLASRADTGAGLVRYMWTQRKKGLWVRFDGGAPRCAGHPGLHRRGH